MELWLAERHPEVEITAIDNAPCVENVNRVAAELSLTNIEFRHIDLRELTLNAFDIVCSHAVIYCIPDEFLLGYFETLVKHTRTRGSIFVTSAANISPMLKLRMLLPKNKQSSWKQTGWMRDWQHVKKFLPDNAEILEQWEAEHYTQVPLGARLPFLRKVFGGISKNIFPLSNSNFVIHMKRK
jgi:trans-aconitate methyltransferase